MRYKRDWWRLQIYHEALAHERKQVVIQFLIKNTSNNHILLERLEFS